MPFKKVAKKRRSTKKVQVYLKPSMVKRTTKPKAKSYRKKASVSSKLIQGHSGQLSVSSARHVHYANRQVAAMKLIAPVSTYSISYSVAIGPPGPQAGQQNIYSIANLGSNTLTYLLGRVKEQSAGGLPLNNPGAVRGVILGTQNENILNNGSNAAMQVDVYECVPKRDVPNVLTVGPVGPSNYTYSVTAAPEQYWRIGLMIQENLDPNVSHTTYPDEMLSSVPTDSALFRDYFIITKKTRVFMAPGASHKHSVSVKTNRLLDQLITTSTIASLKGFGTFTMFCAIGMPCVAAEAANSITTTAPKLLLVRSERARYSWVADTSYTSKFLTTLQKPLPGDVVLANSLTGEIEGWNPVPG